MAAADMWENEHDRELAEYAVGVRWLATSEIADGLKEKGMFANQNSACRLSDDFTRDRVLSHFKLATPAATGAPTE
jgi:hypothetical protein